MSPEVSTVWDCWHKTLHVGCLYCCLINCDEILNDYNETTNTEIVLISTLLPTTTLLKQSHILIRQLTRQLRVLLLQLTVSDDHCVAKFQWLCQLQFQLGILTTICTYWLTFKSHSIITFSLHFNCHFSRWTWVSRFIEAKDDGSGGDNISCKSCKAPVISSPTTNQHPNFYRPDAFVSPNQQCQSTERRHSITSLSFNSTS